MSELKEFTTISNTKVFLDTSKEACAEFCKEACMEFSFEPGVKIISSYGVYVGIVTGVAPNSCNSENFLWIVLDRNADTGKVCCFSDFKRMGFELVS